MIEAHQNTIDINHSFKEAYEYNQIRGALELETSVGTRFVSIAEIVTKGEHADEKVLKFFQNEKEFGRAYSCCWGRYYNCNRTRIGMYCLALDNAISAKKKPIKLFGIKKFSEKVMEDAIAADPEKYLDENGLKLISRQYRTGNYIFDLLFEDRHGSKLIVELQKGTLDRNHTYKILDYYDEYKEKNPHDFIELMVIANKITRERRNRLSSYGIEFKEIPQSEFIDINSSQLSYNIEHQSDARYETEQIDQTHDKQQKKMGHRTGSALFDTREGKWNNLFCHALLDAGKQGLTMREARKASWNPKGYSFNETISRLIKEGLASEIDGRYYLTDRGFEDSESYIDELKK